MSSFINIQSDSVKNLYNKIYSNEISQLKDVNEIKNHLHPYIQNVINDNKSYEEAIKINEFKTLKTHIEDGKKEFDNLDFNTSIAMSIFFYAYH